MSAAERTTFGGDMGKEPRDSQVDNRRQAERILLSNGYHLMRRLIHPNIRLRTLIYGDAGEAEEGA
jgi:hypothetical protein